MSENPDAFPVAWEDENSHGIRFPMVNRGMTLRDWFAGRAMSMLADPNVNCEPATIATAAYAFADAFLAEREK